MPPTYELPVYARMLNDNVRTGAYAESIRAAVRPGAVVLEIGTGTGFMALLACKHGAKRVYALEPANAIVVARNAARDNGFADRIVFQQALSTEVTLPEKCDVLISDLRGVSACVSTQLADLMDARERLLAPDAAWICQEDVFQVAVTELPDQEQALAPWDQSKWGLDLRSALPYATNQGTRRRCHQKDCLSLPARWARIHYPTLNSPHVRGTASLEITRDGEAQGLVIWFDAELFGGYRFSSAPGSPCDIYGNLFLPWPKMVPLRKGDRVSVRLDAVLSQSNYVWNWATVVTRDASPTPVAEFKQSTLRGELLDGSKLSRAYPQHKPALSLRGEVERFLLEQMDGQRTQAEIAVAMRERFAGRFPNDEAALARVMEAATRFCK